MNDICDPSTGHETDEPAGFNKSTSVFRDMATQDCPFCDQETTSLARHLRTCEEAPATRDDESN